LLYFLNKKFNVFITIVLKDQLRVLNVAALDPSYPWAPFPRAPLADPAPPLALPGAAPVNFVIWQMTAEDAGGFSFSKI